MVKRLTDTEKWKDDWYLSLSNDYRIVWQYLLDSCDHAGILKKNMKMLNFCCNTNIDEKDIKDIFDGRLIDKGDYYFIPKFLRFQYDNLNSERPVIVSVRKLLDKNNLSSFVSESFGNDYLIIKSKDKSKDKDKEGVVGETFKDFKNRIEKEYRDGNITLEEKNKELKLWKPKTK